MGADPGWHDPEQHDHLEAVNGKQYVAVLTGEGVTTGGPINQSGIKPVRGYNALYVFALP